ncbi:MAG: hypothetical protein ACXW2U_03170 [Telluria sp.]
MTLPRYARFGALALLFSMAACSVAANGDPAVPAAQASPAAPATPVAKPASQGLWQQIQAEIGDASCDTPAQCKTIAVGHKSCGGPESYAAWSSKNSDGAKLSKLAADYAAQRKAENERSGMVSNCMMVQDPGATCSAQRCVVLQRGAGASVQ